MKLRVGDPVKVISGKDKGKVSEILRVLPKRNAVVVKGVNLVKKHVKPNQMMESGGIVSFEKPIDVSNVMYYNEALKRAVRVGFAFVKGKKIRVCKKTGKPLDETRVKTSEKDESVEKPQKASGRSKKTPSKKVRKSEEKVGGK